MIKKIGKKLTAIKFDITFAGPYFNRNRYNSQNFRKYLRKMGGES